MTTRFSGVAKLMTQEPEICQKVVKIRRFITGYGWTARDIPRNCILAVAFGGKVNDPYDEWMNRELYLIWNEDVIGPIDRLDRHTGSLADVEMIQRFGEKLNVRTEIEPEARLFP